MDINIVHFFSKTLGGGENNPVRSSISDFFAIFMQNMVKTHQLEHVFFNFSWRKITHSKSVAIIDIFYNK